MFADPIDDPVLGPVRRPVREFLERAVRPRVAEYDRIGVLPRDIIAQLGQLGIYARPVPVDNGGQGASYLEWLAVVEEIGRIDTALRTFVTVQTDLVIRSIGRAGSPEQIADFLDPLVAGQAIGAFCFTEPDAGSDAAAAACRATPSGDGFELSGEKAWITYGRSADVALVIARDSDDPGVKPLSAYLVRLGQRGWNATPIDGKLGMRALEVADVQLDAVEGERLGPAGSGWRQAMAAVDDGRLSVAAGSVGLTQACLEAAVTYAGTRQQFGKPVASFQLVQELIADTAVDLLAARELVCRAARLRDMSAPASTDISAAKLFATEVAERAAYRALQVHGSHGYSAKYPVERYYRDARGATLYQGTSQIQRLIIGRTILGVNAIG